MDEKHPYSKALRIISSNAQAHANAGNREKYEEAHEAINELLTEQEKEKGS